MIFIKEQLKPFSLFLLVLGIFLVAGPPSVRACDMTLSDINMDLDGLSGVISYSSDHEDGQARRGGAEDIG